MPEARPALIVRLRNWVGDVTLGVPMLQRVADAGYALHLVGKAWAAELLAGHGWPLHVLAQGPLGRVAQLRRLKAELAQGEPGFARRLNALCLPYSFSSALDFRLAGLRALGHAYEGRSPLLARARARPRGVHELRVYWDLGDALLGTATPAPQAIGLRVSPQHRTRAHALRAAHGLEADCILVCPFAGGTWSNVDKTWPAFAEFVARDLPAFGRRVVICPGPGAEEGIARAHFASALLLAGVDLGTYAALLQDAALMIANDTGPGHIAAAVGTPLVSVLGPSDPAQWGAWGPDVHTVQRAGGGWPDVADVRRAVAQVLATR